MIPLRTSADLKKFPTLLFVLLFGSFLLTMMFSRAVSSADSQATRLLVSAFIFPSVPLGFLCLWYLWIFYPNFRARRPHEALLDFFFPFLALSVSVIFLRFQIEAAWSFVFSVMTLGAVMRGEIWENVETLVVGPKLFSLYAVPCYVHLFFFLFYIFLAQLWRPAFGMPEKSIYLVTLLSFIAGFLVRSIELKWLKEPGN